jgi:hypothetical protein
VPLSPHHQRCCAAPHLIEHFDECVCMRQHLELQALAGYPEGLLSDCLEGCDQVFIVRRQQLQRRTKQNQGAWRGSRQGQDMIKMTVSVLHGDHMITLAAAPNLRRHQAAQAPATPLEILGDSHESLAACRASICVPTCRETVHFTLGTQSTSAQPQRSCCRCRPIACLGE